MECPPATRRWSRKMELGSVRSKCAWRLLQRSKEDPVLSRWHLQGLSVVSCRVECVRAGGRRNASSCVNGGRGRAGLVGQIKHKVLGPSRHVRPGANVLAICKESCGGKGRGAACHDHDWNMAGVRVGDARTSDHDTLIAAARCVLYTQAPQPGQLEHGLSCVVL
jgi:hypothetical protein